MSLIQQHPSLENMVMIVLFGDNYCQPVIIQNCAHCVECCFHSLEAVYMLRNSWVFVIIFDGCLLQVLQFRLMSLVMTSIFITGLLSLVEPLIHSLFFVVNHICNVYFINLRSSELLLICRGVLVLIVL